MKTVLRMILAVMVAALMVVFLRPSFESFFGSCDGVDEILIKVAEGAAAVLFFGYYVLLLWKEHVPRTP